MNIKANTQHPAVFLDRDGTINQEQGYLTDPSKVALLPTVVAALRLFNTAGLPVVVITNQSAIGRGLMSQTQFEAVSARLSRLLASHGVGYDALYYCPHNPETTTCACRKPQPGLLQRAAQDLDIDLEHSFLVGDKRTDIEAGQAVRCRTVLVRTGRGENTYRDVLKGSLSVDYVAQTLLDAAGWVIRSLAY